MKFRRSPDPLSDPAFSADPLSHPYHNIAWSVSPPAGHPVIGCRNKKRPTVAILTLATLDSEFQLIQPPNSPVSDSDTPTSPPFPFPRPPKPLPTVSKSLATPLVAAPSPSVTKPPSPAKQARKFRMPFLTRRKTTQPQHIAGSSIPTTDLQPAPTNNDVTQRPRPAAQIRRASEPLQNLERPGFPPRPATTGTNTPRSTAPFSVSAALKRRNRDLDRIDELDETSPWGVALHHGGPYEAAVKAIRRSDKRIPLGVLDGGSASEYHRQAMLAHGNVYIPPQVPTGVSLNLSPGQILPMSFKDRHGVVMPPRFKSRREPVVNHDSQIISTPPSVANYQPSNQSLQPESFVSRPHLQPWPPSSSRSTAVTEPRSNGHSGILSSQASVLSPFPNPHLPLSNDTKPNPVTESRISHSQWQSLTPPSALPHPTTLVETHPRDFTPTLEKAAAESSLSIGMAMLEPEFPQDDDVADEDQEFNPYDLVDMENEHTRTPPLDPTPQARFRGPSLDPRHQTADRGVKSSDMFYEKLSVRPQPPFSQPPPPYSSPSAEMEIRHQQPQPPSQAHPISGNSQSRSRIHTPEPTPSMKSNGPAPSDQSGHSSHGLKVPRDNSPSENLSVIHPRKEESPQDILRSRREHDRVQPQPLAPSNHDRERDGRSTHQSISTYSSGQSRGHLQRPPHRHMPKHLVMPAPLNNNGAMSPPQRRSYQLPLAAAPIPRHLQVQFRPESQMYHSSSTPLTMSPILDNSKPLGPPVVTSRKLKKRVSLTGPSAPPIITTVSFAPPVIGFQPNEKIMMRSKSEKVPKRVLSKRG